MKPIARTLVALLILILAAGGVFYYWSFLRAPPQPLITTTQRPVQFEFFLDPPFFHVGAGGGRNITVYLQRSSDFSGTVKFELVNPPDWIVYTPFTVEAKDSNATFTIIASQDAPKTELNLTMRSSSAGVAEQYATLEMKVVGVHAVTSEWGSAVVFDTTKVIDSDTLKVLNSYSDGTFVFSKMTPQLQSLARGDVLVVPPSSTSLAKHGLLRLVLSMTQQGGGVVVQTIQATLFDELQEVNIGETGSESAAPQRAPSGLASSGLMLGDAAFHDSSKPLGWFEHGYVFTLYNNEIGLSGPVNIGGDTTFNFQGKLALYLLPGINIRGAFELASFKIHLAFTQHLIFSLHGTAGSQLNWIQPNLAQLYGGNFYLIPPILWVSATAKLEGRASGILNQNIELNLDEELFVEAGPTYDADEGGWRMYYRCNSQNEGVCAGPTFSHTFKISPGSGSDAKLGIGPRIEVGINGDLGVASSAGGAALSGSLIANLKSQIPSKPSSWVDWGIDAYFGLGLSITIGRYGISHTFGIPYEWPLGTFLGPYRLFDGPNMAPLVDITNPKDGTTFDYNQITIFPTFTATATDPEDGDLCGGPKSHLVWSSDIDGQIGTGCSVPSVSFKKEGTRHITFTAMDSDLQPSSSKITVTVTLPKPTVKITKPQSTDTIYRGQSVTLEGYAGIGAPMSYLSCDKLVFSIVATGSPSTFVPHTSTQSYCAVQVTFNAAGPWRITLTATDTTGIQGTATVDVTVKEPPSNLPPKPEISDPKDGAYYIHSSNVVTLTGTVYDQEGDPITSYAWYSSYLANPSSRVPTTETIATGTLSTSKCIPTSKCTVTASLKASDYCGLPAFPYELGGKLTIVLEATETSPSTQTGRDTVTINLGCKKPLASPPRTEGILLASLGGILAHPTLESRPSLRRRLEFLLRVR